MSVLLAFTLQKYKKYKKIRRVRVNNASWIFNFIQKTSKNENSQNVLIFSSRYSMLIKDKRTSTLLKKQGKAADIE